MIRKTIAIIICIFASQTAYAVGPVLQATANLSGLIQTQKSVIGKNAGVPQNYNVRGVKSISLNNNALVNLGQGFAIDAKPVPNVTLGYDCDNDRLVVVQKVPGSKPQTGTPSATLTAGAYVFVSGVISAVTNGITSPAASTSFSAFNEDVLFTPTGMNPTSQVQDKIDPIGLMQITAPAFGVPIPAGTAPTGIQPLVGVVNFSRYTGDPSKIPTVTSQCGRIKSIQLKEIHGAILAKPGGPTDLFNTVVVITGGTLSVGNTLLGYH